MRSLSSLFRYGALASLALGVIGVSAALSIPGDAGRYTPVCALVDNQDVDGLGEVVAMQFVDDRIYLMSNGDNCLTVLSQAKDGTLNLVEHLARDRTGEVPAGSRKLPHDQVRSIRGTSICRTRDGRFLFVPGGLNILLFEHDDDKSLKFIGSHGIPGNVFPPRNPTRTYLRFAISIDDLFLFTHCCEVLRFDRSAKRLESVQLIKDVGPCRTFCMSPDGRNLYGSSSSANRLLYVFSIDPSTRRLTEAQRLTEHDRGLRHIKGFQSLEVSPDGRYVVATCGMGEGEVLVFHRDKITGQLSIAQTLDRVNSKIDDLGGPECIAFSADAQTLYVGCTQSNSVVVLRRKDPGTDVFSYVETIKDPSIKDPTCLGINGQYLFVCSREPGTLTVLRINEETDKSEAKADNGSEKKR